MMSKTKKIVIYLDLVLLIMTASWVLFGLSKGIDTIELIYNYIYMFVIAFTLILNLKLIYEQ